MPLTILLLTAISLLSCVVMTISFLALIGYFFGIDFTSGWGAYTRMAIHTAVTFFVLCCGILAWAWQSSHRPT